MREVKIKVYNYDELSDTIKEKVLENTINSWSELPLDIFMPDSNIHKAYAKAEEMQTPWFYGSYIYEYCKDELLMEIRQYEYFKDGTIYIERMF